MKSISIKLWGLMLGLVFIALILIWCFQIVFLESFYFSIQEKKLLKEGRNLVEMINTNEERTIIEEKLNELLLKYNARIDLYTSAGVIIYSSESSPKPMIVDKNEFLMEIMQSKKAVSVFKHNSRGSLLLVGLPVIRDNVMTAAVIMTVPVASLKETVDTLKEQFIIISLILISVSSILAYVFSRYFTRPILEISNAAKAMAEGNLSIKVPVSTKDELGMLSATINHLSTQLQKIEQLRKELISNVSHEFKTPLSLIKGYAETIRDVENLSEEKRDKQLSIIIEESDKLNYMINEIMDLSQIQSDYYKLDKTDFRIKETIKAVVNRLTYHIENKKLCIEMDYKDDVWVHADERRMEQVLYNLLNNAINFSKEEDCIFIRVIDKDKLIEVEIVDQGAGISPEEIPYIWDRFYKSKEASAKHKGSGLGLAIVKGILDAHKLNFGVESEIGRGSRFWFEITKSA
jgi:signal transduction histidine kinase